MQARPRPTTYGSQTDLGNGPDHLNSKGMNSQCSTPDRRTTVITEFESDIMPISCGVRGSNG